MPYDIDELRSLIDAALERALPQSHLAGCEALNQAVRCAVYPGGKRMRPVFTLLAACAAGVQPAAALDAACGIELLHSASLIFDDLPCMDDADLRRHRPAVHLLFGESVALLAGLALMNEAYALLASNAGLVREAARCIGVNGMIGGQAADVSGADLASRDRKTTALMRLTLVAGAMAGGACPNSVAVLADCGERLGRAYQMLDDLVDNCPESGKTAAQDDRHGRATWLPSCTSAERIFVEVQACGAALEKAFGPAAHPLVAIVGKVFARVAQAGLVAA